MRTEAMSTRRSLQVSGASLILAAMLSVLIAPPALSIPTPLSPHSVAVNRNTNRIYVVTTQRVVSVIDGATEERIIDLAVPESPGRIAVNRLTNRIYVTHGSLDRVTVINGQTHRLSSVRVGDAPNDVAVNPATNRIYVTNSSDDTVAVIDGETRTVIATVPVGDNPLGVGVNTTALNKIYVSNIASSSVSVIDGATNSVIATIPTLPNPYSLGVNWETDRAYVIHATGNVVSVIDGSTNTVVATIPIERPRSIAVDSRANRAYVTSYGEDFDLLSTIDGNTDTIISTAYVGLSPSGVAVNPVTERIYVANTSSNNLSVVHAREILRNPSFDGPLGRFAVPIGWKPRNITPCDVLDSDPWEGKFGFKFCGAPGISKELFQAVDSAGPAGTTLVLEGYSRASSPLPQGGPYRVMATVFYVDSSRGSFSVEFTKGTHDWERKIAEFTASRDFTKVKVSVQFHDQGGQAVFDALHLWTKD